MNFSMKDPRISQLDELNKDLTLLDQVHKEVTQGSATDRCLQIIEANSKSFSFASRLLPPRSRADAAVLYAWCRRVDDAVDEVSPDLAPRSVKRLQAELDQIYSEMNPPLQDDILIAFRDLVKRHRIPKLYPQELIKGMQMDVEATQYESLDQLYLYCYRVASVVGLMMCHILKISDQDALQNAAHLGIAMQLTNICRDVSEDWARSRLYLPRAILTKAPLGREYALSDHQEMSLLYSAQKERTPERVQRFQSVELPALMVGPARFAIHKLLDIADLHYQSGYDGVGSLPGRSRFAIRAAGKIYQDIGRIIRDRQCDPNQPRAVTSKFRKLCLALSASFVYSIEIIADGIRVLSQSSKQYQEPSQTLSFERFLESSLIDQRLIEPSVHQVKPDIGSSMSKERSNDKR